MNLHHSLHYFCLVAQLKSFTKAAQLINVSSSAISQSILQLERHLSVRLLHRNTRSISLTEAGQQLFLRIEPMLNEFDHILDDIKKQQNNPTGTIKITMPYIAWSLLIHPKLLQFTEQYPEINLDIQINDGLTDIVLDGFDLGIRSTRTLHETMIATALGSAVCSCLVASPNYIERYGLPKTPQDIDQHICLGYRFDTSQHLFHWALTKQGKRVELTPFHRLTVNNESALVQLALMGKGLAYVFEDETVQRALKLNLLIQVLDDWEADKLQYYLYYPNRKFLPLKLRTFIDYFK